MDREKHPAFHYIHHNAKYQQGFTLLELVITVSVMSILLAMAAPSFSQLIETNKIKRLATEVEWFLVQAKSEAVMRNQDVHIKRLNGPDVNQWCLFATLSAYVGSDCSVEPTDVIAQVVSDSFTHATLEPSPKLDSFLFEPTYGKPENAALGGNYEYGVGNYSFKTVLYTPTGRLYTCILTPDQTSLKLGGYEKC